MSEGHATIGWQSVKGWSQDYRGRNTLSLFLVLTLACFLRFYHLDGYGLWSDEFVTLMIVSKSSWLELIRTCFKIPQPMPPLYFIFDQLIVAPLGPSEISLRLLSALSSTLVVYFVFLIGRILFDCEVGLFASLLCAINSIQIVYAQNARPYAFCLLLSTVSILSFLQWMRSGSRISGVSFIVATTLLLYSHYIFLLVLLIQNLYFLWIRCFQTLAGRQTASCRSWKSWLFLQLCVAALLLPLGPQLWAVFESRQTLDWAKGLARYEPRFEVFFFFWNARLLFFSLVITPLVVGGWVLLKRLLKPMKASVDFQPEPINTASPGDTGRRVGVIRRDIPLHPLQTSNVASPRNMKSSSEGGSLPFLLLWYLVPVGLFFILARMSFIHLFVERYLVLASLATYLWLAAIPLILLPKVIGRSFLIVYLSVYAMAEPGKYFWQKGQFSGGVPGGNEWRETLSQLGEPAYSTALFLFQCPFIESNQLNFDSNDELTAYLSTPLRSFYVRDQSRPFELLPVHWWIDTEHHAQFKMKIKKLLMSRQEFVLLSTEEFWSYFKPWMNRELSGCYEVVADFESSGDLRLKRIKLLTSEGVRPQVGFEFKAAIDSCGKIDRNNKFRVSG
jgi:Dolichyl-phosphate-mannose-protein mannosyltransferase